MFSIMTQSFHRNILSSRFFQQPKRMLGNSNPYPFQSSHLRYYVNSSFPQEDSTNKFLKKEIVKQLSGTILNLIVAGIIGGFAISVDLLYGWYLNSHNESLLNETLEKGTRPDVKISEDKLVSRPVIVERLKKILLPHEDQSNYYVVCGEHGTGKTTLTRIASKEVGQNKKKGIEGGRGVIYVDIPADIEAFGEAFGKALNFTFEERISVQLRKKLLGDTNHEFEPKWKRAMKAFKHASAIYKKNNPCHQPPVIIYDNISHLVHKNPEIIDILQDDAKDNADDRKYIAVFVSNERTVLQRMKSRSAWSRAKKPVMEIGDLNKEESMEYLIKRRNIKEVDAEKLYNLIGGRIVDLKTVADDFLAGQPFKVIKQSILGEVEKKFNTAQLLRKQLYHEVGKKAINALLNSKELDFTTFMEFFNNYEEASKVLEANIFAYHPEKNTVSFQSQSVECYIQENKDIFIK